MRIFTSHRFLKKAYGKGNPVIQRMAEHAVHDFIRSYRSDPRNTVRRYDRVAGVRKQVLEIDISGSNRLLAHFASQQLTLLDLGKKSIVPSYNDQQLARDLASRQEAPDHFWPERSSGFFYSHPDIAVQPYGMELYSDWLYWLDEEQHGVLTAIQEDLRGQLALLMDGPGAVFFIIGGPGTGKSCILINLLKYYVEESFDVGLVISDTLVEYVEQSTGANIDQYRVTGNEDVLGLEVLLVDDPATTDEIGQYAQLATQGGIRILVLAFDPLQLDDSLSDQDYRNLVNEYRAKPHVLTACYRQKKNVGQATKNAANVIAASTPFLREDKIETYRRERTYLTQLANQVTFRNPHGYTRVYEDTAVQDVIDEVKRINKSGLLWRHWYCLLVVEPYDGALHPDCYRAINQVKAKTLTLNEIQSIKGLEFQHVFLFLTRDLYEQIEYGFRGSGQRVYNQRRLLRIPFSRAKDSLVTFVLD